MEAFASYKMIAFFFHAFFLHCMQPSFPPPPLLLLPYHGTKEEGKKKKKKEKKKIIKIN